MHWREDNGTGTAWEQKSVLGIDALSQIFRVERGGNLAQHATVVVHAVSVQSYASYGAYIHRSTMNALGIERNSGEPACGF